MQTTLLPRRAALAAAILLLLASALAEAQYPGGGSRRPRGESMQGMQPPGDRAPGMGGARATVADPIFGIEHELPSLRTDLNLTPEQAAAWGAFERAVRDVAELARQREKKLLAPRALDAPAPKAPAVLAAFADDDRMRSEAMAQASSRLKAVYDSLSAEQRSLLDRRVLLAQAEPLGTR